MPPPDLDELATVQDLQVHFPLAGRAGVVRAVDGVSFGVQARETLGLIGESGSGKTTLGRAVAQLVRPTAGRVLFRGVDPSTLSAAAQRRLRRNYQVIFQDPSAALDPRMRVSESIREPLLAQRLGSRSEQEQRVRAMLERVSLAPEQGKRYPHQLSGGQKQRVNIARALILQPELIVCDESVSALDASLQADILNLFVELQREFGLAYLFISHNLAVVAHIADRIAVMYLGRLVELGPATTVVRQPSHPYTEALISANPEPLPRARRAGERIVLRGEIPSAVQPPSGCRFRTRCPYAEQRCEDEDPAWRNVGDGHWVACHFARGRPAAALPYHATSPPAGATFLTNGGTERPADLLPSACY